jgi:hypothetical protein
MVRGNGQTWSLDLVLAAGIFILILIVFYTVLSNPSNNREKDLKDSAQAIANRLGTSGGDPRAMVIENGKLNDTKLSGLSKEDYLELKRILGTSKDFCIYIEDENDRLIPINGTIGIGGDAITIDGQPCNGTIT